MRGRYRVPTFYHQGDIGDIVAMLPSLRHMGGGHIVIGDRDASYSGSGPGFCRESMQGPRYEAVKPLLEAQPYVMSVSWGDCPPNGIDVSFFRNTPPRQGENIADWQARHLGLKDVSLEKWLYVDQPIAGPVVFARSQRYHNPRYPWPGYCDKYRDAVFVGSEAEHSAICSYTGHNIPHRPTPNLLELARVMAGAERVLCNQSAPYWIAAGLDRPLVLEVCPDTSIQNCNIPRAHFHFIGNADQADNVNWH